MPLIPKIYRFKCPKCKELCMTTHLRWQVVNCLHCPHKIKNNEVKLIK